MSVKVIAYDVGTTGLKTCLFSISAEESVRYLAGEVEKVETLRFKYHSEKERIRPRPLKAGEK